MEETGQKLRFRVVESQVSAPWEENLVFLVEDAWDDWFTYSTMYQVIICDDAKSKRRVGAIKIGQIDMAVGQRRPAIPRDFEALDERFFSLGESADYYEGLNELEEATRTGILVSLNDMAANLELFVRVRTLSVTQVSLLRGISRTEVEGQFHRMTQGAAKLTPFHFAFTAPKWASRNQPDLRLEFKVEPESFPPTNVHVLIGRNGVGKTHTLNLMVKALAAKPASAAQSGFFERVGKVGYFGASIFSNLVSVCFSAFDSFELLPDEAGDHIRYEYIGLRRTGRGVTKGPKSPEMLATEFVDSAIALQDEGKHKRWKAALETLESDRIFAAADITSFIGTLKSKSLEQGPDPDVVKKARDVFEKLSSGHQIVLLTITRLVQSVEEQSIVLLDEPEGHLHPPLLAAFVRSLSDLLYHRNGVAIIATHSPVVLQEVPKSCAWKIERSGRATKVERPEVETFGENLGILTREVFGYQLTSSGFHRMLRQVADTTKSYEAAISRFEGELGDEARAILRVMFLNKERGEE